MNHLVQFPPLRSWPGGCSHKATWQRGLHHAAMVRCTWPPQRPGSSCRGRDGGTRLCQRSWAGSACLWAALTQRMLPLTAEGGGEAEMSAEGWAGTRLAIPVTCPASRSASAVMRAEGAGQRRAPGRAIGRGSSHSRGVVEAPRWHGDVLELAGAGDPGVHSWLWSSGAAAFPSWLRGPARVELPLPPAMLRAARHRQMLFLALQCCRWQIYRRAQWGGSAFPDHHSCCGSRAVVPGKSQLRPSGLTGQELPRGRWVHAASPEVGAGLSGLRWEPIAPCFQRWDGWWYRASTVPR